MQLKQRFHDLRPWQKGGMIGAGICLILFPIYYFLLILFFPTSGDEITSWLMFPMIATGHFFILISQFIFPYGWLCDFTVPLCIEGSNGICLEEVMRPTSACAERSGFFGLALFATALTAIYFTVGAGIGSMIAKGRK